jgi:HrpA-like RNA helicase
LKQIELEALFFVRGLPAYREKNNIIKQFKSRENFTLLVGATGSGKTT